MEQTELPIGLRTRLESLIGPDPITISVESDVDSSMGYGQQWLVATETEVLVLEQQGEDWSLLKRMLIADLEEVRTVGMVGVGLLEGISKGHPVALLYFTNAVAEEMNRAARALDCMATNRPMVAVDEEESTSRKCPTCGYFMDSSRVCPRCLKKTRVIQRLVMISRPYWKAMSVIMVMLLIGTALNIVPPLLTKTLIDKAIPNARYDLLFHLVLALVGLHLASTVLGIFRNRMTTRVSCRLTYDLREQMFGQLQSMSVSFYDKNQVGSLMARVTRDTEELQSFISQMTSGLFYNLLMIIGVGCMLLWLDWRLCLFVMIPWPFVIVGTLKFWKNFVPKIKRLIYARWRISAGLNSALSGIRVVKAFAQEQREDDRFRDRNQQLFDSRLALQNYSNTYYPIITFFFPLGGYLVWYLGGRQAAQQEITLGSLMAFIALLGRFQAPMMALTQTSNQMTRFLTAAQRIFEILDQTCDIREDPGAIALGEIRGEVEFKNVSFGYLPNQLVLQGISLRLRPGEMLGIVGPSGAGKTTLSRALINKFSRKYNTALILNTSFSGYELIKAIVEDFGIEVTGSETKKDLIDKLNIFAPKECVTYMGQWDDYPLLEKYLEESEILRTYLNKEYFSSKYSSIYIEKLVPTYKRDKVIGQVEGILSPMGALAYYVSSTQDASGLCHIKPFRMHSPKGRMNLIDGIKNTLIIDDTYNSSPQSAIAALGVLHEIKVRDGSRKFAVLGDMYELGNYTEQGHSDVGKYAHKIGVDKLITVGEIARDIGRGAEEAGMKRDNIFNFRDAETAGRFLQNRIKENDLILIKGSQGVRTEKIVLEIMADPLKAKELLVRQGKEWREE